MVYTVVTQVEDDVRGRRGNDDGVEVRVEKGTVRITREGSRKVRV